MNCKRLPWRTKMMPEKWYQHLDPGIRFAVRVLHASGFETTQSCQGGRRHAYEVPTVDLVSRGDDASGFAAVSALQDYGLRVRDLQIVWPILNGLPYERLWRITFRETTPSRADEQPSFVFASRWNGGR